MKIWKLMIFNISSKLEHLCFQHISLIHLPELPSEFKTCGSSSLMEGIPCLELQTPRPWTPSPEGSRLPWEGKSPININWSFKKLTQGQVLAVLKQNTTKTTTKSIIKLLFILNFWLEWNPPNLTSYFGLFSQLFLAFLFSPNKTKQSEKHSLKSVWLQLKSCILGVV